jgi:hypothetical protein
MMSPSATERLGVTKEHLTDRPNGAVGVYVLSSHGGADVEIVCERTGRSFQDLDARCRAHVPAEANDGL